MGRYFFDTEFDEQGADIKLISIGIVGDDGRELYCINRDYDASQADDWLKKNVIAQLPPQTDPAWKSLEEISKAVRWYFGGEDKIELWAYFASYDWVVFCKSLFGRMINLPKQFPFFCRDLKQYMWHLGIDHVPIPKPVGKHDALVDARWNMELFRTLRERNQTITRP